MTEKGETMTEKGETTMTLAEQYHEEKIKGDISRQSELSPDCTFRVFPDGSVYQEYTAEVYTAEQVIAAAPESLLGWDEKQGSYEEEDERWLVDTVCDLVGKPRIPKAIEYRARVTLNASGVIRVYAGSPQEAAEKYHAGEFELVEELSVVEDLAECGSNELTAEDFG